MRIRRKIFLIYFFIASLSLSGCSGLSTLGSSTAGDFSCGDRRRAPHLTFLTATSVTVGWECAPGTLEVTDGAIKIQKFGEAGGNQTTVDGLIPGHRYSYQVVIDRRTFGQGSFRAPKSDLESFSFLAFGDSGSGNGAQRSVAAAMGKEADIQFGIITGDVVYPGGADGDYDAKFYAPYRGLIDHLPFLPAVGNHDIQARGGEAFLKNFYLPQGRFYYDFWWGRSHFIALDSNEIDDPDQMEWLKEVLAEEAKWKVVFFHHPPYSSSSHGSHPGIRNAWGGLFQRFGVDLVLTGHDHGYERTKPINGTTYIVTGGGGQRLYPSGSSEFTAAGRSTHHFIRIDVRPETLTLQAIGVDGRAFDAATLSQRNISGQASQ